MRLGHHRAPPKLGDGRGRLRVHQGVKEKKHRAHMGGCGKLQAGMEDHQIASEKGSPSTGKRGNMVKGRIFAGRKPAKGDQWSAGCGQVQIYQKSERKDTTHRNN